MALRRADGVHREAQTGQLHDVAGGQPPVRNPVPVGPLVAVDRLPLRPFRVGDLRDRVGHSAAAYTGTSSPASTGRPLK